MPIGVRLRGTASSRQAPRDGRAGVVLLTTLLALMLLSGMVVGLQVRTQASVRVLARIEARHVQAMAETAVLARVAAGLAGRGPAPALRGVPVKDSFAGRGFTLRLTDVEGLVDLYLAPPEVLALLPVPQGDGGPGDGQGDETGGADPVIDLAAARDAALAGLVPGERFAAKVQTLARLGLDAPARAALAPLVTQSARTGEINPQVAPDSLQASSRRVAALDIAQGQAAEVEMRPLTGR